MSSIDKSWLTRLSKIDPVHSPAVPNMEKCGNTGPCRAFGRVGCTEENKGFGLTDLPHRKKAMGLAAWFGVIALVLTIFGLLG